MSNYLGKTICLTAIILLDTSVFVTLFLKIRSDVSLTSQQMQDVPLSSEQAQLLTMDFQEGCYYEQEGLICLIRNSLQHYSLTWLINRLLENMEKVTVAGSKTRRLQLPLLISTEGLLIHPLDCPDWH